MWAALSVPDGIYFSKILRGYFQKISNQGVCPPYSLRMVYTLHINFFIHVQK